MVSSGLLKVESDEMLVSDYWLSAKYDNITDRPVHVSPLYPVAHLQTNPSEVERHFPPLWHGFGWQGSFSVMKKEKTRNNYGCFTSLNLVLLSLHSSTEYFVRPTTKTMEMVLHALWLTFWIGNWHSG